MWIVDNAVVVGAGIGGLTASLLLSRVAARVTLVERAERPYEVGAALALQPNGMADLLSVRRIAHPDGFVGIMRWTPTVRQPEPLFKV